MNTMTTNATDDTNEPVADEDQPKQYAELNIGDEEFVIYDRNNHQAWLQSSIAVRVDEFR